ncbi:hypothetical protein [Actinopolymorpha pittospori]|uniref:Uncharacterized protein n=1 Tax=Actinopolymorpha pittospori TaxID=648752 RepID=A0A927N0I7_9ACTN|nr:hypothetical protein [Actinopolymorpha pittospori]MBE1610031.1 hypothetical protein [Actinopolymorpha pittospori]
MGQQRRHSHGIDGYELSNLGQREALEDAVQAICEDMCQTGRAGIYSGDGQWRG